MKEIVELIAVDMSLRIAITAIFILTKIAQV
jgi:hypothetical protein